MIGFRIVALHSRQSDLLLQMSQLWVGIFNSTAIAPYMITQMFGPDASRKWNTSYSLQVGDADVVLITGLGHGGVDQFTGFKGEVLYSTDPGAPISSTEAQNKVVHLLSCSTANGLNAAFLRAGSLAFIGYTQDVPLKEDSQAWLTALLTCDAQIEFSMIKGATVSEALADAKRQYSLRGLNYIGDLLASSPNSSNVKLRPLSNRTITASLPANSIAPSPLPPPNTLTVRRI